MSITQRSLAWIEARGGVATLVVAARLEKVHLRQVADDHGKVIIAASRQAFKVLS